MLTLEQIISAVIELLPTEFFAKVYLFGSYVRGEASENSDVDLHIWTKNNCTLCEIAGFRSDLVEKLGVEVDVVTGKLDRDDPFSRKFANNVKAEEVLIYSDGNISNEEIKLIDLTDAEIRINRFGGSEKKITVLFNQKIYMVKFPDPIREQDNDLNFMYNAFSEDIGCKIFKSLGFEVQNTFLAKFNFKGTKKIVVACEDFCDSEKTLSEFSKFLTSDLDFQKNFRKVIPIETVSKIIDDNPLLKAKTFFKNKFWDMFVADSCVCYRQI